MTRRNQLISEFVNGGWMNISYRQLQDAERVATRIEDIIGTELTIGLFDKYVRNNMFGKFFNSFNSIADGVNSIIMYNETDDSVRVIYEYKCKPYYIYIQNGIVRASFQMTTTQVREQIKQFIRELEFDDTYLSGCIIWNVEDLFKAC